MELNILCELKELRILDLSSYKVRVSISNINSTIPKFSFLWLSSCNLLEFLDFLKYQNELRFLTFPTTTLKVKYLNGFGMLEKRH